MADTKVSALTSAGTLAGTEEIPCNATGSKKTTAAAIKTLCSASPTLVTPNLGTPSAGTLTNCTGLPVAGIAASTATALGVGSIELGHASDTSITRVSAGLVAIEGVNIVTTSATQTLTNKTLTSPTLTTPALGTPASGTLTNCSGFPKIDVFQASEFAADAGANDTYAITLSPAATAYVTGTNYRFKANTANTGAATLNVNAIGAKTIVKLQGGVTTALADNDIRAGQWVECVYDGTNMQMISAGGNVPAGSGDVVGPASATDNAIVRFDATTGKLVQNSVVTVADTTGDIVTPGSITTGSGGSTAGYVGLGQGTAPSVGTTSVQIVAPAAVTSYNRILEGSAGSTGFYLGTVSGTTVTDSKVATTGSGSVVLATSATLVTPVLGTPTSGNLSACTADGTTLVGFLSVPANSQSAAYTAVLADSGKSIDHPSTDANARTFTIPANASVAYPVGTCLSFSNMTSQAVTIAINSDTLYLAGTGTTGSRTLAQYGVATARKLTSTTWIINGSGLT